MSETNECPNILPCRFKFHEFTFEVDGSKIQGHVVKMKDSFYLWLSEHNDMHDLGYAFISEFDRAAVHMNIIGEFESLSVSFSHKLSQKFGKPVYVSYNGPVYRGPRFPYHIMSRIMKELEGCNISKWE